jgi:preprotein translocase subunit SecE
MKNKIINYINEVLREMKKVSWPSSEELKESTGIVITTCLIFAIFTFAVDKVITELFKLLF